MRTDSGSGQFPPTHWTVVIQAGDVNNEPEARKALASLCQTYWYPLYAFARRQGLAPHDAQDATQGFFAYLLDRNLFAKADRTLGTLRTFLLTAFTRFCGRLRAKDRAQKRGGGQAVLSLDADFDTGERRYSAEPSHNITPEQVYSATWAHSVLDAARENLEQTEKSSGRGKAFKALEGFLERNGQDGGYESVDSSLGLSPEAVRQAVSRLRRRYREAVRDQIASTLSQPTEEQIEQEMSALRAALS